MNFTKHTLKSVWTVVEMVLHNSEVALTQRGR